MGRSKRYQRIPTSLTEKEFTEFVLPHLTIGRRGPPLKVPLHRIFNYILKLLHTGCQWSELPIEKDASGKPEIHYTRVFRIFQRWQKDGCFEKIFAESVKRLSDKDLLDTSVLHGDGSTTCAKKGAII